MKREHEYRELAKDVQRRAAEEKRALLKAKRQILGARYTELAELAAAKGDADAAAAITMTTDRQICLNECARRGHNKDQCANACRPGLCHPGAEQPYCIAK